MVYIEGYTMYNPPYIHSFPPEIGAQVRRDERKTKFVVVCFAAHVCQLADQWHLVLSILKLGRNPQSRTADQLVVLFVHDPFRHVTIDNVEGKVENLGS